MTSVNEWQARLSVYYPDMVLVDKQFGCLYDHNYMNDAEIEERVKSRKKFPLFMKCVLRGASYVAFYDSRDDTVVAKRVDASKFLLPRGETRFDGAPRKKRYAGYNTELRYLTEKEFGDLHSRRFTHGNRKDRKVKRAVTWAKKRIEENKDKPVQKENNPVIKSKIRLQVDVTKRKIDSGFRNNACQELVTLIHCLKYKLDNSGDELVIERQEVYDLICNLIARKRTPLTLSQYCNMSLDGILMMIHCLASTTALFEKAWGVKGYEPQCTVEEWAEVDKLVQTLYKQSRSHDLCNKGLVHTQTFLYEDHKAQEKQKEEPVVEPEPEQVPVEYEADTEPGSPGTCEESGMEDDEEDADFVQQKVEEKQNPVPVEVVPPVIITQQPEPNQEFSHTSSSSGESSESESELVHKASKSFCFSDADEDTVVYVEEEDDSKGSLNKMDTSFSFGDSDEDCTPVANPLHLADAVTSECVTKGSKTFDFGDEEADEISDVSTLSSAKTVFHFGDDECEGSKTFDFGDDECEGSKTFDFGDDEAEEISDVSTPSSAKTVFDFGDDETGESETLQLGLKVQSVKGSSARVTIDVNSAVKARSMLNSDDNTPDAKLYNKSKWTESSLKASSKCENGQKVVLQMSWTTRKRV